MLKVERKYFITEYHCNSSNSDANDQLRSSMKISSTVAFLTGNMKIIKREMNKLQLEMF